MAIWYCFEQSCVIFECVGCTALDSGHCEYHFSISERRRNRKAYHPSYAATHCCNSPVTQRRRHKRGPRLPGTCVNRNNKTIHHNNEGPSCPGSARTSSFVGA